MQAIKWGIVWTYRSSNLFSASVTLSLELWKKQFSEGKWSEFGGNESFGNLLVKSVFDVSTSARVQENTSGKNRAYVRGWVSSKTQRQKLRISAAKTVADKHHSLKLHRTYAWFTAQKTISLATFSRKKRAQTNMESDGSPGWNDHESTRNNHNHFRIRWK